MGHANGFISLWSGNTDGTGLQLYQAVDVRNTKPTNPWGLHNIRGISTLFSIGSTAYVVGGSEDGYISVLSLPDGAVRSQTVYNPAAQRGINSVAAFGQNLLIANCSVGSNDKNLWYYWIDGNDFSVTLKDSANLQVNPSAPQVFNFCTIWGLFDEVALLFFDGRGSTLGRNSDQEQQSEPVCDRLSGRLWLAGLRSGIQFQRQVGRDQLQPV